MSNCFPYLFHFPTTSRRVFEKTISFCTNQIHIQLFKTNNFLWICIIKGMFRVTVRVFASKPFRMGFAAIICLSLPPPLNVVNQISHNSSCLGKNDTKSWIYFIYFLGIRLHVLPKSNLWRDNQNLIFLLNANQEKIRPE